MEKLKVLIADDEPMMRKAYQTLLDLEGNGFSAMGYARNGKEALDMMRKNGADIVITDLKMPLMSGTELIASAKAEFPMTKFIVVSGYDDFALVKEAYSLGAKDYFLKSEMEPETVMEKLSAIADEIIKERESALARVEESEELMRLRGLEKMFNSSQYTIREKLLKELIWSPKDEGLKERMSSYGICPDEKDLRLMVINLCSYYEKQDKEWFGEHELFKYAILNVLSELCEKYGDCVGFQNLPNEYIILSWQESSQKKNVSNLFADLRLAFKNCFAMECCGAVSPLTDSCDKLKDFYRNVKDIIGYSFVLGRERLLFCEGVSKNETDLKATERVHKLKSALSSMHGNDLREIGEKLRVMPQDVGYTQIEEVKKLFYLYYNEIVSFIEAENIKSETEKLIEAYKTAQKCESLHEMNKWLTTALSGLATIMMGEHVVIKAKSYIKAHYREQITLSSVAKLLQISESHLSRSFQKMQKESFTQYLQRTRMEAAVELLRTSNMKIYEISKEVGYTNSEQFSRMFKKVIGCSPKAFVNK